MIFLEGGIRAPTFFGHSKFEVKKFSEFFPLPSTLDSEYFGEGGCRHQLFLVIPNLRSKSFSEFFLLLSALD